jgi:transcriptional regulator with XRE-family HTH domain
MEEETAPQTEATPPTLLAIAQQIRAHRKALGLSAEMAAESAGLSRLSWHRIERGLPGVHAGAYARALATLGLTWQVGQHTPDHNGWIPARVRLADYPQLRQLAWQTRHTLDLPPQEAWSLYERNWRHLDQDALLPQEQQLIDALKLAFGDASHV